MPPTDQSRNHVGELNERKNCEEFQNHFEKPPGSKIHYRKTRPSPETANLKLFAAAKTQNGTVPRRNNETAAFRQQHEEIAAFSKTRCHCRDVRSIGFSARGDCCRSRRKYRR
ncbi:hypothetical protein CT676_24525 [Bradyrhizobium sp. MOS001]|nr:hypothetical protein CT676_24525 [Bradyrhizobium sp. MOS001]